MIGDTKFDIAGAKHFGLKSLAVTYGYGTEKELLEREPDFVANSPKEILQISNDIKLKALEKIYFSGAFFILKLIVFLGVRKYFSCFSHNYA